MSKTYQRPKPDGGSADTAMNLRDWFAGHAPEPPGWFQPKIHEECPKPEWGDDAQRFDCNPINQADITAYGHRRDVQRIVQWRYAYADAMIAERNGPNSRETIKATDED